MRHVVKISRKFSERMMLVGIATASLAFGGSAMAATHHPSSMGKVMMEGKLFGNIPNVTIRGVDAGKAPWIVAGSYQLTDTHFIAQGKWLIIPKNGGFLATGQPVPAKLAGTTAGITEVGAEITFANAPAVVLPPVKLNAQGDFTMNATFNWPKGAKQPVVLIGPETSGKVSVWFASSNFLMDYGLPSSGMSSSKMTSSSSKGSNW